MSDRHSFPWHRATVAAGVLVAAGFGWRAELDAQAPAAAPPAEITYARHIAPILQRSCENCHRPDGVAPMSLRHLRGGAPVGARDQAAHRHRPAAPA